MTSDDANLQPEFEPVPKPTIFEETVAVASLMVAALSLFFFGWMADSVSHAHTQNFDLRVRDAVHGYASPGMTRAMVAVSFVGGNGLAVVAIVALILFLRFRRRRAALWLIVTLAGATVLDLALKYAYHRPRPVPFFGPLPRTYSFPSGHALYSFCFYGVLAGLLAARVRSLWLRVVIWTSAALLVFSIGLSRIYLGVHYPSDVIAGYLTATLWVATMIFLDRWRKRKKMDNVTRSAVVMLTIASVLGGQSGWAKTGAGQAATIGTVRVSAKPAEPNQPGATYRQQAQPLDPTAWWESAPTHALADFTAANS